MIFEPMLKLLHRLITRGANCAKNQSEFLAITRNLFKAREKSSVQGVIGFVFASHWLKNWREFFTAIKKRGNHNRIISFHSHFNTVLSLNLV